MVKKNQNTLEKFKFYVGKCSILKSENVPILHGKMFQFYEKNDNFTLERFVKQE